MRLTEYDKILQEARAKAESFKPTAREYIPKLYSALRNENPNLTPDEMLSVVDGLISKYDVDKVYIDGANPSFIKSLKLQIGQDHHVSSYYY
jgi:hypothetical protein